MSTHHPAGRRILVTGAGKGIGRATVERLVADGAEVVALSRTAADLRDLHEAFGCDTIEADLADLEAAADAVARALPFDGLVNNAGITALEPALSTGMDTMRRVMEVNTLGPLRLAQVIGNDLVRRGVGGAIVNISSTAADVGLADHAAYCASKAALNALTRVLAKELGPHNIRVNSINPTVTLTPMGQFAWSDPAKSAPVLARIPLGRFLEPPEVAGVVSFLLGNDAAMISGVCLAVDGGLGVD
ncbi:SDR family oxidoreductase [Rhizosaccharibacter radicis]|uniref:SDR family oxidoreductase n=1 Tax=Rhizosaccharibacter radicis TaxID=2782605 RepID=A0ABT1VSN8_9PROT|nr:SDR family oxidoreductase [Acetobacteraceae bacterium KSS12]